MTCIHLKPEGYASAPTNIALLKYWGKQPGLKQIPTNASLSWTLGALRSSTKVVATQEPQHTLQLTKHNGSVAMEIPEKMVHWLDTLLEPYAPKLKLAIHSTNNFPTACGLASSASGYAALTGAVSDLLGLQEALSAEEHQQWLIQTARLGSGSACRSAFLNLFSPFVSWQLHDDNTTSCHVLPSHPKWLSWHHGVTLFDEETKSVSSSQGHLFAISSPFHAIRVAKLAERWKPLAMALRQYDVEGVQEIAENDMLLMHAVMQTSEPSARYFSNETSLFLSDFFKFRSETSCEAFVTLDAGPNVHFLCSEKSVPILQEFLNHAKSAYPIKGFLDLKPTHSLAGLILGPH